MFQLRFILFSLMRCKLVYSLLQREKRCMYIDYIGRNGDEYSNCIPTKICSKTFNISYVQLQPYFTKSRIEDIIQQCCGNCTQIKIVNNFRDITNVRASSLESSHFVFPFLGHTLAKRLYGYHFIPIIEAPNTFYFTPKDEHAMVKLLGACLQMYPLILICILMAVVAGFIAWIMETWFNRKEFPRPFISGWFEGFWWSFVSMTTVGYGDKTPRSCAARIFSVLWILVGIITFDILTATLTAEVTMATTEQIPHLEGQNIGCLKYRMYEAYVISKHGGNFQPGNSDNFLDGIIELMDMLEREEIQGFLLDMYAVWFFSKQMKEKVNNTNNATDVFAKRHLQRFNELRSVEKMYTGEKLSFGVLVRDLEDYNYFHDVIVDNGIVTETMLALEWNENKKKIIHGKTAALTSASGPFFRPMMNAFTIILALIFTFGIVFELYRRRTKVKKVGFNNSQELIKEMDTYSVRSSSVRGDS